MAGGGFLLCCTFILFVATVVAQNAPKTDVECTEGSKWRKDCNWCSCDKGIGTCTRKGCLPGLEEKSSQEPECQGTSEWKKREIGNNKCSWCVCDREKAVCNLVQCSKGNGQVSNQPNIGGGQDQNRGNDKNQPTDFGGPQNKPNDFGGPQNKPNEFGGPQNQPNGNDFGGPQNKPTDFGAPQNGSNEFGGSPNPPKEFGISRIQSNAGGGIGSPQNDFGNERNPPNSGGSEQDQPNRGSREQDQPNRGGSEQDQPNRGGREQDQPTDIGGSQNQTSQGTRNQRDVQNHDGEGSKSRGCTSGSRWRDRCNWCRCGEDLGAPVCTRRACRPGATIPGPECEGSSEWKKREGGVCSWCVCEDGKANCDPTKC